MDHFVEIGGQPVFVLCQHVEALLRLLKFADFARNIRIFE